MLVLVLVLVLVLGREKCGVMFYSGVDGLFDARLRRGLFDALLRRVLFNIWRRASERGRWVGERSSAGRVYIYDDQVRVWSTACIGIKINL